MSCDLGFKLLSEITRADLKAIFSEPTRGLTEKDVQVSEPENLKRK